MLLTILAVALAGFVFLACGFSIVCLAMAELPSDRPTIEQLAAGCQDVRGWEQVERAQQAVHAAMPDYGFCNGFDTPRMALARGRGYCWQRAGVLLRVLRRLGVDARMVHAFRNRFEGHSSGHVWLVVTVDGEDRWVCPGDARNKPGEVRFTPRSKVRRWGPGILALSYLGSPIANVFAYAVHRLRGNSSPEAPRRASWTAAIARNGMWLMLPILAWNAVLASHLPPVFTDDSAVPAAVRIVELLGRVVVFLTPMALMLRLDDRVRRAGLACFIVGTLAYFASWLPPLTRTPPTWLWLGPYLLPAVWLSGLGLMARSNAYIVGAALFVLAHFSHGLFALGLTP